MNSTLIDAIDIIGIRGGKSNLSDVQAQSLQSLIDDVSLKVAKKATKRSTVDDLTSEILKEMSIKGVRDSSTLKVIFSKIVEWELDSMKENFRMFLESNSFSLQEEMNVSDLLDMLPARKEVEILETTTYEVIYTVTGVLNHDEVKCDYISIEGNFVSAFKDNERVAIYNKDNFVRATLL